MNNITSITKTNQAEVSMKESKLSQNRETDTKNRLT